MRQFSSRQILAAAELEEGNLYDAIERRHIIPSIFRSHRPGRPHAFSYNDLVMALLVSRTAAVFGGYPEWLAGVASFLSGYRDLEGAEEDLVLLVTPDGESGGLAVIPIWQGHASGLLYGSAEQPFRIWIDLGPLMERARRVAEEAEATRSPEIGRVGIPA